MLFVFSSQSKVDCCSWIDAYLWAKAQHIYANTDKELQELYENHSQLGIDALWQKSTKCEKEYGWAQGYLAIRGSLAYLGFIDLKYIGIEEEIALKAAERKRSRQRNEIHSFANEKRKAYLERLYEDKEHHD